MKKRTAAILIILTAIVTGITVFFLTNMYELRVDDRIIISDNEYEELKGIEDRFSKLLSLEQFIKENYYKDTSEINFDDAIMKGLFEGLDDPYSVYLTKEEYEEMERSFNGSYSGIGIIVSPSEDDKIIIVSPIEDTPGEKAGLESGDKIIKVDEVDVFGETIDAAVQMMLGEEGTPVKLTVQRDSEVLEFDIIRAKIVIKSVESEIKDDKTGYIRIKMFDDKTYNEFTSHLESLLESDIESLVIDLRNNPGGSLDEVIKIADRLLGEQKIVSTVYNSGESDVHESDEMNKVNIPMAVLVNGGSASASEILAGAIQDGGAGTIIGETTFGKGLVQTFKPLTDGTGLKLTIAYYLTPNGNNIHKIGIIPDINEDKIIDGGYLIDEENDGVLEFALNYLREKN